MARLHLFDLDGTLLHGTSAPLEISRQLGLEAETMVLEQSISAGMIGPPEYATQVRDLWTHLTDEHVTAAFEGAPWLSRIRDVWAEIRRRGEYCAVVSLSPSFLWRGSLAGARTRPVDPGFRCSLSPSPWTRREY